MTDLSTLDRMRRALARCTFLPGSSHKRFARQVAQTYLDRVTEKQWRHVIRLAWRYRRQMPRDLVPSKDAVEALDQGPAAVVAGIVLPMTAARPRAAEKPAPPLPPLPLFEQRPRYPSAA